MQKLSVVGNAYSCKHVEQKRPSDVTADTKLFLLDTTRLKAVLVT